MRLYDTMQTGKLFCVNVHVVTDLGVTEVSEGRVKLEESLKICVSENIWKAADPVKKCCLVAQ